MTNPAATPADMSWPKYMRPLDVVRAYGVNERSLRRMIAAGDLPAVRLGRRVFVPAEAVRELFENAT